ncbi:MAG: hypothetical protein II715_01500, partial [Clostridia bacterium]|nr:hypothetical protein [Clostridia bacterium]
KRAAMETEFEFELPKGYVDKNGDVHRRGTMRLATAADEILPMRDPRVQQNAGYLTIGEDGSVILTDDGLKTASRVYERHTILTAMLMSIGVSRETAEDDACRIEHYVSQETFDAMKAHYEKYLK